VLGGQKAILSLNHRNNRRMVGPAGLEPATKAL
jgi:hypothetical protein